MKELFIEILNTQAVQAAIYSIAGIVVSYIIAKIAAAKPEWKKYEGTITAAILTVEKLIPQDASNPSLRKLDAALRMVLQVFAERNGRDATEAETHVLRDGIQVKHGEMKGTGALNEATKDEA